MRTMPASSWIVTPDKFLRPEQVQVLRARMEAERRLGLERDDRSSIRNAAIVEVLLGTGLRVSESCSPVISDLYLDPGSANVLVRRGKGGKTRLVAISDRLRDYLADYLDTKGKLGKPIDPTSPLFLSERRGRMCRSAVHRIWKSALERAGLPKRWGVHATRHSFAVEVFRKTRDLRLTQRLLGHGSPAITQVYASLLDDDVRRGVGMVWA